jgi:hypothetical protein
MDVGLLLLRIVIGLLLAAPSASPRAGGHAIDG